MMNWTCLLDGMFGVNHCVALLGSIVSRPDQSVGENGERKWAGQPVRWSEKEVEGVRVNERERERVAA